MTSSSLINPWAGWADPHFAHVLYSFPLSFSFRKRPNRAQELNVKKRDRTPLQSPFQTQTMGQPTSCTAALKPWLKLVLLAIDWGCKAKTNKNPHCWGLIMTGPHLQSTGFKWLVGFCFLSRCVSVCLCVSVYRKGERWGRRGWLTITGGLQTDSAS